MYGAGSAFTGGGASGGRGPRPRGPPAGRGGAGHLARGASPPSGQRLRAPAEEFSVGDIVDGQVVCASTSPYVFVDVGAEKDAFLVAPISMATKLEPKVILKGLRVTKVDQEKGRLTVALDSSALDLAENHRPVSDFSVGEVVDGSVVGRCKWLGVFIDISGERDALLDAPTSMATKLEPKEMLKGLRVTKVDQERGQLMVAYDDLDAHLAERHRPVSSFAVGDAVDGVVVGSSSCLAVFIDIGAERNALLHAPIHMATKLEPNEVLKDLRVTAVDQERGELIVSFAGLETHLAQRFRALSEFTIGDVIDGEVVGRSRWLGVFIDVGAEVNALLHAPMQMATKLEANEMLNGLRVTKVDREKGLLHVVFNRLEAYLSERFRPLSDFSVGEVVDGLVIGSSRWLGVFIDVGGDRTAVLDAPVQMATKLEANEMLKGLRVTGVDQGRGRLTVVFDDLQEFLAERYKPLSDFSVGDVVDGVVVGRSNWLGVFIDVGAERNALLHAPMPMATKLEPRETLRGLRVSQVDRGIGELNVAFDGLEAHLAGRYKPLSEFSVGDVVDGQVLGRTVLGVLVDIGADRDALLRNPIQSGAKLEPSEMLKGLRVTEVDPGKGRLSVFYDNLRAHLAKRHRPLSDLSVGEIVDGVVVRRCKSSLGVFIDIGAERDARLDAPVSMATKLNRKEMLKGLRVTKVDHRRGLPHVIFDGLEAYLAKRYRLLSELSVNDVVEGVVVGRTNNLGVLVDIGAERSALLDVPIQIGMELEANTMLQGLRVTRVDEMAGLSVTLDNLEEFVKGSWLTALDDLQSALDGQGRRDFEVEVIAVQRHGTVVRMASGLIGDIHGKLLADLVGTRINATLVHAEAAGAALGDPPGGARPGSRPAIAVHFAYCPDNGSRLEEGQVVDAKVVRVHESSLDVKAREWVVPVMRSDISSDWNLPLRETFRSGEHVKCYVCDVVKDIGTFRLSIRALEFERGALRRRKAEVFARAEETAKKFFDRSEEERAKLAALGIL